MLADSSRQAQELAAARGFDGAVTLDIINEGRTFKIEAPDVDGADVFIAAIRRDKPRREWGLTYDDTLHFIIVDDDGARRLDRTPSGWTEYPAAGPNTRRLDRP